MNMRIVLAAVLFVAVPHISHADDGDTNDDCPEAFRGASISTSTIHDGVTLTFTTEAARMSALREQLREVATMVEQKGTEVQTASYDEDAAFPPVDLEVFDIEGGAKVSVRASRPRDIPELRILAKQFEKYWSTSKCNGDVVVMRPHQKAQQRQARRSTRQARR